MSIQDHATIVPSAVASIAAVGTTPISYGVHFGMPEGAYHAAIAPNGLPYLGTGDVRDLIKCPMYYWQGSALNPMRETRAETPALLFGRALHKLVLEGRAAFEAGYAATPEPGDYPGCLETVDHIKDALRKTAEHLKGCVANAPDMTEAERKLAYGEIAEQTKLTGNKPDLVKRIKTVRPDLVIFDEVLLAHLERCADGKMATLKRHVYEQVITAAAFIASSDRVRPAFTGGRPEISVFWDENGVPMKCRLDYVRIGKRNGKWAGLETDLKSFSNSMGMAPERAVVRAIAEYRLDVQAAIRAEGAGRIADMMAKGLAFGTEGINSEWLAALGSLKPTDWSSFWAFFQTDAPVSMLREAKPGLLESARVDVGIALQSYRDNMQKYGTDWRYVDVMADIGVDVSDMPSWIKNVA